MAAIENLSSLKSVSFSEFGLERSTLTSDA